MRWFVEVASSSHPEASEKWVVEASQWQPALQAARSLRGEAAEMAGFSIRHFRRIIDDERIQIVQIGRKFFILTRDFQRWQSTRKPKGS